MGIYKSIARGALVAFASFLAVATAQGQTLQQAIQTAVDTNPEILITVNQRSAINQELKQAQAGYLPTLDATAGIGYQLSNTPATRATANPGSSGNTDLTRREAALRLSQNLFKGFGTKNEVTRNKARVDSSAYGIQGKAEDLSLDVTEAYLNVLRSRQEVSLARQNVEAHVRTLKMIKLRSETGISRGADLVQAEGRLALARANLQSTESDHNDFITKFFRLVGQMPENLQNPTVPTSLMPKSENEAIEIALENNPTLKSSRQDVRAADAQHDAAKAPFYPSVNFNLEGDWNNNLDGVEGEDDTYFAMFRGNYNLFNGGADVAYFRQTAFQSKEAREVSNRTVREVVESIRLSWNAYVISQARLPNLKEHQIASEETVVAYRQQFQIGQRTLLDLLDAENESFQSKTSYLKGRYEHLFAKFRVLDDMGRLLAFQKIQLPKEAELPTYTTEMFG